MLQREVEMTENHVHEDDKGKDKISMLTSHDDGYTEPICNTSDLDNMDESILDDEEEWHGEADEDAESIVEEEEEEDAEMVIERPFGEPQAALLDPNHAETLLNPDVTGENPLEPISLNNILPPGSRRRTLKSTDDVSETTPSN